MRLDPIVIGPYDPSWPASFDAQRSRITPVLAPWLTRDIEHMGSTVVPGLPAKDIVDMLAVVAVIDPVYDADRADGRGWDGCTRPSRTTRPSAGSRSASRASSTGRITCTSSRTRRRTGGVACVPRPLARARLRRARVRVVEGRAGGRARRRPRPTRRLPRRQGWVHPHGHRGGVARRTGDERAALTATPERPGRPARG